LERRKDVGGEEVREGGKKAAKSSFMGYVLRL
jgi:hypothetical protein